MEGVMLLQNKKSQYSLLIFPPVTNVKVKKFNYGK